MQRGRRSGGGLDARPRPVGGSGGGGDPAEDPEVGLLVGGQVGGLALGSGGTGSLAVGVTGADRVESHRRGDLPRSQSDPGARFAAGGGGPGFGQQVVGQDGDAVALVDRLGGAGGKEPEGGDLDPAGGALAAGSARGQIQGYAQFHAVGAV